MLGLVLRLDLLIQTTEPCSNVTIYEYDGFGRSETNVSTALTKEYEHAQLLGREKRGIKKLEILRFFRFY